MKYFKNKFFNLQSSFFTILISILLFFYHLNAQENTSNQPSEVIAKGLGSIIAGDEAKASEDALASALRQAVEQVVGTMIESNVLVQNYQVVEDQIYSRTKGYVKSYQILNNRRRDSNIWETTVKAVVKKTLLESDLDAIGVLINRKNKPRVMVLIDEKNMGQQSYDNYLDLNTCETEFTNQLSSKGFIFVDRETVARKIKRDAVVAVTQGNEKEAQLIAQESGVELLIIGRAASKAASGSPSVIRQAGMISCQATISLKAIRADDGRIIATSSYQVATAHIDQLIGGTKALKKVAAYSATELIKKILKTWQQDVYSGSNVSIRILNIPSFKDLLKFKNMMKAYIRGIQKIHQREFTGSSAVLEIELQGNTNQIAEEFALKNFNPYQINIVSTSQNSLVIKLNHVVE